MEDGRRESALQIPPCGPCPLHAVTRQAAGCMRGARLTGTVQETWVVGVVAKVEEDRLGRACAKLQDLVVHRDEGLWVQSRVLANGDTGTGRTSASLLSNNFIL